MAESTSPKPPIAKLGLGLLIADDEEVELIVEIHRTDGGIDSPDAVVEGEEVEFRNAIERDLCRLTIEQAEIERLDGGDEDDEVKEDLKTVEVDGVCEETVGKKSEDSFEDNRWGGCDEEEVKEDVKNAVSFEDGNENRWGYEEDVYEGKDVENSEGVGYENENGWGYKENQRRGNEESEGNLGSMSVMKFGRNNNQSNYSRKVNYPMRPEAEDCAFYMKFGSCKFGLNCKFNHPPRRKNQGFKERASYSDENSERAGQTECKFYLTSGGCRYGKDCKFSHGSDKSSESHTLDFNFLGLPIRPGEKECPYYMRTGTCKYGSNCRFHHPEPSTVVATHSSSGYGNDGSIPSQHVASSSVPSWSSPGAFNETSSFSSVMFPPTQGAPPTSNPEWHGYQAATYPTSERSLPTPPAFALNNLTAEINFPIQYQHDNMVLGEYPERPGEPECSYFLKTGDCKFKSNCRFHHPKSRISNPRANSYVLNDKGLPLRPDQPICTHYHRYGICKYGPACKYDHSSSFANLPAPFDQSPFGAQNSSVDL